VSQNSPVSTTPTTDVVDYLTAQHEAIKKLFVETLDAGDADTQREAFTRLRTMLAVHETAEEMFVHPRARRKLEDAGAVVDARLTEEHDSKVVLQQLEKLPHGSAEFSKTLIHLQAAVLKHADLEESEEFTLLRDELDNEELRKLTAAVKVAESIAPTHPHPGVESSLANFAAGPFASLLDRSRDALRAAMA
jgi:Hemerythrin HHE cation binding domain